MSSEDKPARQPSNRSRAHRKKAVTREELLRYTEHDPEGAEKLVRFVDNMRHGEPVAEKVSAVTVEFFAERKAKADRRAFRRTLDRKGGEPPRSGDELP